MLLSVSELPKQRKDRFDACVIGSGPAGITITRSLVKEGFRVVLLEAGGRDFSSESQDVYRGRVVGDPYFDLDKSRLRYFGGTSGHWAGWCRPLDPVDFSATPDFPDAAWPISKSDLDPYLDEAARILNISPRFDDRPANDSSGIKRISFEWSSPIVCFGESFFDELASSPGVCVCLQANVTEITPGETRIESVTVEDYEGNTAAVQADTFVLATGGIENCRLLLWANARQSGKLLDQRSPVGKYWMEHPHFALGEAILTGERIHGGFYSLSAKMQRSLGILNCGLRLRPLSPDRTRSLIDELACVAPSLGRWVLEQFDKNLVCGSLLRAAWEQEPIARNRVELSARERDRFGVPRSVLHWSKTRRDLRTARLAAVQLSRHLVESRQGRVRLGDWVWEDGPYPTDGELAGNHHMGGTRMSETPTTGVVDQNCKVFGLPNLYIAGSSVFPAAGHANPTLTIVQLALRLADHLTLKGRLNALK